MTKNELISALESLCSKPLAKDLASEFLEMALDATTGTTGRAAPGKFVETIVQVLQHIDTGKHSDHPKVDAYLRSLESTSVNLSDDLRISLARIARSMYTLRNKRNIAHKGAVDPNSFDLRYLFSAAQWAMAELIRSSTAISMEEAGALISKVQAPIDTIVEQFDTKRIVLADVTTKDEALLVLRSIYPGTRLGSELIVDLDRRKPATARKALRELWDAKLIEGESKTGFGLTQIGFKKTVGLISVIDA